MEKRELLAGTLATCLAGLVVSGCVNTPAGPAVAPVTAIPCDGMGPKTCLTIVNSNEILRRLNSTLTKVSGALDQPTPATCEDAREKIQIVRTDSANLLDQLVGVDETVDPSSVDHSAIYSAMERRIMLNRQITELGATIRAQCDRR